MKPHLLLSLVALISCGYERYEDPPLRPEMVLSFCSSSDDVCKYSFESTPISTIQSGSIDIYSSGIVDLYVKETRLVEGDDEVFRMENISEQLVPPGGQIVIGVSFAPVEVGYTSAKYLLLTDAANAPSTGKEIIFEGVGAN